MHTDTTQATQEPGLMAFQFMASQPTLDVLPGEPGRVHRGIFSDPKFDQEPPLSSDVLFHLVFGE
jgi:hypothetical protein